MKKLGFALFIALIVLAITACSLEAPATGRLTINVPTASAKGASGGLDADILGTKPGIRIYIKINGSFIKASGGAEYFASDLHMSGGGDNTITIDLPPAKGYQVLASIGNKDSGWVTEYYGETDSFAVSAGASTAVPLTVKLSPFRLSTTPSSSKAFAAYVGGRLWLVANDAVTEQGGAGVSASLSAVGTVNSLSVGYWFTGPELWINTSTGVWAISETTSLIQRISSGNITGSAAFEADIGTGADAKPNSLVVAYYGNDLGVAYGNTASETTVNSSTGNWKIGSLKDYLNGSEGSSLKKLITDPSKLINAVAFVVNGSKSYGFVATGLGAFFYNSVIQGSIGTQPMTWLKDQLTKADYVLSTSSGKKITALALDDPYSPTVLYAGNSAGLFSIGVDTSISGSEKPSGSAPYNLSRVTSGGVRILAGGSGGYVAFVDEDGNLNVYNGSAWTAYPFYCFTATPSGSQSLVFYKTTGQNLAVASSDGVVTLSF